MQTFKKLLFLLTPRERKNALLLLFLIIIMAILDMIGVASILPFMAVLTNPSLIETNSILQSGYRISAIFGIQNQQQFLFFLGIIVFILLVISLLFKSLTTYAQVRFVQMREYSIGKRLIEGYLHQPYSWFLFRHSSDVGKTILSEVQQLINDGMFSLIELVARGMIIFALITLLILADPKLAFVIGLSLAGSYSVIFYFLRNFLTRIGEERLKNNHLRFKVVSEAFNAAKEVKVGNLENNFIKRFSVSAKIYAQAQALSRAIALLPRFILEAIAFGGILLIILYFLMQTGNFNSALPILSLYVFAGYRLMPALQQVYASFTNITFIIPSLDKIYDDLKNMKSFTHDPIDDDIPFKEKISLTNISYSYPNTSRLALKDININIPIKTKIGLVGSTGCGKTTTIDIILGLLEPQNGSLEVDGKIICKQNIRSWQKSIGYVPQNIYLSDDTIFANIAFGLESKDINYEYVKQAAKIANLHNFIEEELTDQYETIIGERGVRLSGGQRQRIGIARALYHRPRVLILDEATSALDNQTEIAVMEALNNLGKDITTILIAHRLSTVKNCDKIYLLEKGKIENEGTFEELINNGENLLISNNMRN